MTSIANISVCLASAGAFATLLGLASSAQGEPPRSRIRHAATAQPTRIEVDSQSHTIRFFVAGKEAAVIDGNGLKN